MRLTRSRSVFEKRANMINKFTKDNIGAEQKKIDSFKKELKGLSKQYTKLYSKLMKLQLRSWKQTQGMFDIDTLPKEVQEQNNRLSRDIQSMYGETEKLMSEMQEKEEQIAQAMKIQTMFMETHGRQLAKYL